MSLIVRRSDAFAAHHFGEHRAASPALAPGTSMRYEGTTMELSQVRLLVTDFSVMFRFYRDVLGFKPQQDDERGPYGKLSPPSGSVAIALQTRAHFRQTVPGVGNGAPDNVVLALKVDHLDAIVATLRARGVELLAEPSIEWGRIKVAHFRDPEQNLLELQQWLTPAE